MPWYDGESLNSSIHYTFRRKSSSYVDFCNDSQFACCLQQIRISLNWHIVPQHDHSDFYDTINSLPLSWNWIWWGRWMSKSVHSFNALRQNKPICHVSFFLCPNNLQNLNSPSPSFSFLLSFAHQQLSVITKRPQKAVDEVKREEGENSFWELFYFPLLWSKWT